MDKQTITRDIKKEVGNWPNQTEIARYLGKSRDFVQNLMRDCECLNDGRSKKYLASDVAERIIAYM